MSAETNMEETLPLPSIFRNKNFVLLLVGQIVSNIGNALYSIAVIWYLMSVTDAASVGLVMSGYGICMVLPHVLIGPIGGAFVDRFDRKRIIYGTDFMRAVLFGILFLLLKFEISPIISIFMVTLIGNSLSSFFNSAIDASVPNIVPTEQLNVANSYNGISRQLTMIIGSAAAGFLYYSFDMAGILIINAISFGLSGLSELFIELKLKAPEKFNGGLIISDMKEGLKYITDHGALFKTLIFFTLLNMILAPMYMVIFPKVVKFELLLTARELGIFDAIFAVGAIIGMVFVSKIPSRPSYYSLLVKALLAESIVFILFAVPIMPFMLKLFSGMDILIIWAFIGVLFAIINALVNIPLFTVLQTKVDDEYRGRVFSIVGTMAQAATPIGLVFIGLMSDLAPSWVIFLICGILSFVVTVMFVLNKEIKTYW